MFLADVVDEACGPDRGPWLCRWVGNVTDNVDAANLAETLSPWISILLIILGASIANRILRRVIRRAVMRWERVGQVTVRGRRVLKMLESP